MGPSSRLQSVRGVLGPRLGVDLRSLAAFRVALGSVLLLDLLLRARNLRTFYTDSGVLPVPVLVEYGPSLARLSVHARSGDAWFQAVLFAVAAGWAVALVVGYRTRVATAASLVLLVSLQFRNPYVLTGGDELLQHLLFWSLFLPLGDRWSVDARREPSRGPDRRVFGIATAGLLGQVVVVYAVNAVLKHRSDAWRSGDAVEVVLGLDRFEVLLSPLVRDLPTLLWVANWAWMALLVAAPLLVVLTGRRRVALVGAFAAAHLGMALTMHLGVFPLVSILGLVPFLPGGVWDRTHGAVPDRLWTRFSGSLDRLTRSLPGGSPDLVPARCVTWGRRAARVVAAAALAGIVLLNAVGLGFLSVPPPADDALPEKYSEPRWAMFAPVPPETDRWYVAPAELASGREVDALQGGSVRWDRPPDVTATYPSARARKYTNALRWDDRFRPAFAAYLCDRWNRSHREEVVEVSVYAVETPSRALDPDGPPERVLLVEATCEM